MIASLYVIQFSNDVVKIGISKTPERRMNTHAAAARAHGHDVVNSWASRSHCNSKQNEHELIAFCAERWKPASGREYFADANFSEIVGFAKRLYFGPVEPEPTPKVASPKASRREPRDVPESDDRGDRGGRGMTWYGYREAAAELGLDSDRWLRRNIKLLPHSKFGRTVKFSDDDLVEIGRIFHVRPAVSKAPAVAPLVDLKPLPLRGRRVS